LFASASSISCSSVGSPNVVHQRASCFALALPADSGGRSSCGGAVAVGGTDAQPESVAASTTSATSASLLVIGAFRFLAQRRRRRRRLCSLTCGCLIDSGLFFGGLALRSLLLRLMDL